MKTLELVIPCHNEAKRLKTAAFREALKAYPGLSFRFVDDGSTDETAAVLRELAASDPSFSAEFLPHNAGKAEAVRTGIRAACLAGRADLVGFFDADLATPLEEVPAFRAYFEAETTVEAVIGSRCPRRGTQMRRSLFRRFTGAVMRRIIHVVLHAGVYDTQCGAKVFTRALADEIFAAPFRTHWLFDVEVLHRIGRHRIKTALREHPLAAWHDVPGSNLGLSDTFGIYVELMSLAVEYRLRRRKA